MASLVKPGAVVLDIGCSQMPNPYLKGKKVIGLDINKAELPGNYEELVIEDLNNIPNTFSANAFDCILAGEVLEHLEYPIKFLKDLRGILSKDGYVILSTPNPNSFIERILTLTLNRNYFYTKEHRMLYPQRWLIRLMEDAGFQNVQLYSGGFPIPGIGLIPFPRPWCYQTICKGKI